MPVTTVRAKLRASLSKKLVPVLIAKGFRGPSDLEGNGLVHEYRRSTDQGTQVLEIQFREAPASKVRDQSLCRTARRRESSYAERRHHHVRKAEGSDGCYNPFVVSR